MTLLNVIKSTSIDSTPFDRRNLVGIQVTPVCFTQAVYPYMGDPNAPVMLEECSVFPCPLCARHFEQIVPTLVERFLQIGQAKYVSGNMPPVGLHSTAPIGQVAVRCAAGQGTACFRLPHSVTGRLVEKC